MAKTRSSATSTTTDSMPPSRHAARGSALIGTADAALASPAAAAAPSANRRTWPNPSRDTVPVGHEARENEPGADRDQHERGRQPHVGCAERQVREEPDQGHQRDDPHGGWPGDAHVDDRRRHPVAPAVAGQPRLADPALAVPAPPPV